MNFDWAKVAPTRRQWLLGGGHLAALWAITFVQPLLDLLGKNPDFFVARDNSPGDVLILAIGFTLVPPLIMLAIEWVAKMIGPKVYYAVHFLFFFGIATFLFISIESNFFDGPTVLMVGLALILGALFGYAVFRVVFLKNLMDILIVAPVVILLLFIFTSESSKVIFPKNESVSIGASTKSTTPVLWISFDEVSTGSLMNKNQEIDGTRFPNFKKLEGQSTWYPNETTTSYFTPTAMPGLLTGRVPPEDALPTAADQPENVFSMLSGSYSYHVIEPITQICPVQLCPDEESQVRQLSRLKSLYSDLKYVEGRLVLPPDVADTLPDVGTDFANFGGGGGSSSGGASGSVGNTIDDLFVKGRGGAKAPSEYTKFINQIPAKDSSLTMMHVKQPHQPWKYDVKGEEYNDSPIRQLSDSTNLWLVDEEGVAATQQRQIVQTGYADNLLGQFIRRIKKNGNWDKAMVIVTADHGISFQGGDIPQRIADTRSMGEVANPPLFIKYPGQTKPKVDPIHSMTLDVVPTIAKELGVEGMYDTEGVPLQGDNVPDRDVTVKDVKNQTFTVSIADIKKQRDAGIAERDARFGTGPLYTLGPAPELIGKAVPAVTAEAQEAKLDAPSLWQNYKPGVGLIPMWVTGELTGVETGSAIAVGVNGKIHGTTKSFDFKDAQRFGTLVDPASLKPGKNEITVYEVGPGNSLKALGSN
ncbi:MAG: sulfatase-like hydrolase/transferase [Thermoleophilia bacterium]|nr:sulfatase-like hydrolase/transferase [Thermoleophilia bacterium]